MAGTVENQTGSRLRSRPRWRDEHPDQLRLLEELSLPRDRTIRRLDPDEIERNRDLRGFIEPIGVRPEDVLAYLALADGPFGRYRLVAMFILPPNDHPPIVFCLDGPRGPAASEHRIGETQLCLSYKDDPPERRWKTKDGLLRLFDLARRHVTGEYIWRATGRWPVEEAPHGETAPAPRDPSLALPRLQRPGRNEPCTCGSGRKAKSCCWQ